MAAPTYLPLWATADTTLPATGNTNKVRPREILRTTGWDKGQIPTCEEWNWQLNNISQWMNYLNSLVGTPDVNATPDTIALRDDTGSSYFYNLYANNNLNVTGESSFTQSATFGDGLTVTAGETSVTSFSATGNTSLSGGVTVSGDTTITGKVTSSGSNTWSGSQEYTGEITSSGGNTWSGSQEYTGSITFNGTIISSGTNTWSGTQVFKGNNTHAGTETFSGTLNLKTSSKTLNGYTYLPNDFIWQWGYIAFADMVQSNSAEGYATITLPIPFPTAALNPSAVLKTSQASTASDCWAQVVGTPTTTQITVQIQNAGTETFDYIEGVYWQVVGY